MFRPAYLLKIILSIRKWYCVFEKKTKQNKTEKDVNPDACDISGEPKLLVPVSAAGCGNQIGGDSPHANVSPEF